MLTHSLDLIPHSQRRQLQMAPGLVGEELSELATVYVFSHSSSEFSEAAFHGEQHRESPIEDDSLGRSFLGLLSFGRAKESDQPRVCYPETESSPGSATR